MIDELIRELNLIEKADQDPLVIRRIVMGEENAIEMCFLSDIELGESFIYEGMTNVIWRKDEHTYVRQVACRTPEEALQAL